MVHEFNAHRDLLAMMVRRDFTMRFAGSLLGVVWNIVQPLFLVVIYILVIGTLLSHKTAGGIERSAYSIHLCAGVIPWLAFAEIVGRCNTVLLENANLLRKIAFPAWLLPVTVFSTSLMIHGIASLFLIGLLFVLGHPLGGVVSLYFLALLGMALVGLGCGYVLAIGNIYLRDLGQIVSLALQVAFWFNPIVFYMEQIEGSWVGRMVEWNPLHHFVMAAQAACGAGRGPGPDAIPLMVLLPIVLLSLGFRFFQRHRRDVLDEL